MRLTIILPIFNGCRNLEANFPKVYSAARAIGTFEIIIVNDGSADCTAAIAKKFAKMPGVKVLTKRDNKGKGAAVKSGIRAAKGRTIGYMDMDLAVPLRYLPRAVRLVEHGNPLVIGSRYMGTNLRRTPIRLFASRIYNFTIRTVFHSVVIDHQCGFKFMNPAFARSCTRLVDNRWFFDSEMLIRAQRSGIRPYELPVEWSEHKKSTIGLPAVIYFIRAMARFWLKGPAPLPAPYGIMRPRAQVAAHEKI